MKPLLCKTCGCLSLVPMEVVIDPEDPRESPWSPGAESRFYSCHVCGDNWLTVREDQGGVVQVTFVHQMGMEPTLKRVAHLHAPVFVSEDALEGWRYYVDDEPTDERRWREKLDGRRRILKSVCCN
ncbi:hypothetical protein AWN76_003715 [Rhodothermaceae bacterium RA]|nr:hypothetical protein AWN76_003715 [Rhodothermaceae bacterium RA]